MANLLLCDSHYSIRRSTLPFVFFTRPLLCSILLLIVLFDLALFMILPFYCVPFSLVRIISVLFPICTLFSLCFVPFRFDFRTSSTFPFRCVPYSLSFATFRWGATPRIVGSPMSMPPGRRLGWGHLLRFLPPEIAICPARAGPLTSARTCRDARKVTAAT